MPPKKQKKATSESDEDSFADESSSSSSSAGAPSDDDDDFDQDDHEGDDDEVIQDTPPQPKKRENAAGSSARKKSSASASAKGATAAPRRSSGQSDSLHQSSAPAAVKKRNLIVEDENDDDVDGSTASSPQPSAKKKPKASSTAPAPAPVPAPAPAPGASPANVVVDITRGGEVNSLAAAIKLLSTYFRQQNRPYNAVQLFENFHKRIGKALIDQALEDRNLDKVGIKVKVYGKAKIYYPDQSKLATHASAHELQMLDQEIGTMDKAVIGVQQRERQTLAAISALRSEPSDEEIDDKLAALEASVAEKEARAAKISGVVVDPQAMKKAVQEHNFYRKAWANRKRNVMDPLRDIASAMNKKVSVLISDVGMETDEEAGMPVIPPLIPDVV